ncbi:hypothetical protein AGABI1DRAFT_62973 [Agaricus bisporus var. burnettii JB137-S8]|uniref:ER membrane protein complex subunit 1 n=1 Tax=Agaricus bisporus var. burnettii (strain JB137-S8 / ATCC MYA-4627 / FGSC 10392) TaxID=597362 RepID=K5VQ91_AGABU|nr:uncharacterized protein AGABI1DRAFT_62973 [Agaricus bisporus var. burnettii JB137-S8]EKM76614.1 hypothetical protein AGABI1DRAFT_62973 [Agaricus bisporus var. burnettii JB137-S8]
MRQLFFVFLLVLQSCLVHAVHKSDVGLIDWYKQLVGVPLTTTANSPTFHHVSGRDIILTATMSNVLAALDAADGQVAWRYIFEGEDMITGYYANDNVVVTLSGTGGEILRTFDIQTGVLLLEKQLHPPQLGHRAEPHTLGKHVVFGDNNSTDIYVLTNGYNFARMNRETGETYWEFASPDASSLVIHSKLVLTPSALYLIGIAKSLQSYTLHVTSLNPKTGELISTANIPSSIENPINGFQVLSNGISDNNRIVWLEHGTLKHVLLVPKLNSKPVSVQQAEFESFVDVGLSKDAHIVAIKTDGAARVIKLIEDGIKGVYDFKDEATTNEEQRFPVYSGNVEETGRVHVARVYWKQDVKQVALEIYSGTPDLSFSLFDFDTLNNGVINFVALNARGTGSNDIAPKLLISTYTGNVQLVEGTQVKWNREEALTSSVVAEFAELPPPKAVVGDHEGESFVSRVIRHIADLQKLPAYILHFLKRFVMNQSSLLTTKNNIQSDEAVRDEFGFRQIIVVATMFGKVYGIDSATGNVVWTRLLGLGWAANGGARLAPLKLYTFNGEGVGGEGKGTRSDVVLIVQRTAANTLVDTVLFHIDAATGQDLTGKTAGSDVLEGIDIVPGVMVESYMLQLKGQKLVMLLDEYLQTYTYPDTPEAYNLLKEVASSLYFPLRTNSKSPSPPGSPRQRHLVGYQVGMNDELSRDRLIAHPVWTLSFRDGETVVGLVSPQKGPVASYGKVMANRTTLYKYLNPHMNVVLTDQRQGRPVTRDTNATTPTTEHPGCGVYVVDNVKGSILYEASLPSPGPGMKCNVKATLTENWLAYHYYDPEEAAVEEARGWRLVTVEFYEGDIDKKTKSSEASSFSEASTQVQIFEDVFVFPQGITAMTMTKTKFGISTKDLIVATNSNKIQSYPRRLLDPRRPRRKPTNQELEEGLMQYEPVLFDHPKAVLSHEYDVARTQHIITAPSLLESTSLVFATGLDMFLTRTSPSGTFDLLSETFNKKQLIWTVGGLLVALLVAWPMVREKKLNGKWYF